jgi:hypothetical protein
MVGAKAIKKMKSTNKKIHTYLNKLKTTALLLISLGFITASVWTGYVLGWVFFGLCAAIFMFELIFPNKPLFFLGSKKNQEHRKEDFYETYYDTGDFDYTEIGFIMYDEDVEKRIEWADIQALFAYKMDKYVVDEICLDVFYEGNKSFKISEETRGWYVFLHQIAKISKY